MIKESYNSLMSEEIWSGNEGSLCVYVSKAKDLPNLIKLDKQNVILRLRIAHMTRESDVQFRAGQNPIFNYLEKFEITPGVKPVMYVEAYCERKKKAPLPIGRCEVDLMNGIRADPKEGYCTWYELKRDRNEFAGTIFIELTFKPNVKRGQYGKVSKDTLRLDASVAARPMPLLPTDSRMTSSLGSVNDYSQRNDSFMINSLHSNHSEPAYMHASEMRQITPSLPLYSNRQQQSSPSFQNKVEDHHSIEEHEYNNNNVGIPNFTSSVDTSNTTFTQNTSSTTVSSTSAETRFHFANLKKLKERINIFKNPNMSLNKEQQQGGVSVPSNNSNILADHAGVDIEALEKAIGVTSLEDNESRHSDDMRNSNSSNDRQSYRRPSPPANPQHINKSSVLVEGSRRNSDRRSPTRQQERQRHNESPRLPTLPDDISLSSSLNSYRRNSRSPARPSSSPTRRELKLPPLPDERIMSSLSNSGSPRIPRLPASPSQRPRAESSSPIRRPLPPGY